MGPPPTQEQLASSRAETSYAIVPEANVYWQPIARQEGRALEALWIHCDKKCGNLEIRVSRNGVSRVRATKDRLPSPGYPIVDVKG
jgi:hypothetical protein